MANEIEKNGNGKEIIQYQFFQNEVYFFLEATDFMLRIDCSKDNFYMTKASEHSGEDLDDDTIYRLQQNHIDMDELKKKYDIYIYHYLREVNRNHEKWFVPMDNVLAGTTIWFNCGEGLLDFINANFEPVFEKILQYLSDNPDTKISGVSPYERYASSMNYMKDLYFCSLYTAVCPAVFFSDVDSREAVTLYYRRIIDWQKKYSDLFSFCFDDEYYPDVLGDISAYDRFFLYQKLHNDRRPIVTTEHLYYNCYSDIEDRVIIDTINNREDGVDDFEPTEEYEKFAQLYNMDATSLHELIMRKDFMYLMDSFCSVSDILKLDFLKMLDLDLRYRKCRRCGRYFVLKGNHDAKYCERIAEGENRSCRELAAQENYKSKIADKPEMGIYSKYYKRYSARVRVGQITEEAFKLWKYTAMTKRNECTDGKITVEELVAWMEASFPNRKKKGIVDGE